MIVQARQRGTYPFQLYAFQHLSLPIAKDRGVVAVCWGHVVPYAALYGSDVIERLIASHRENPRSKRSTFRIKSLRAIPHTQEAFLDKVFRDGPIVDNAKDQRIGNPAIAIIELPNHVRIPRL